MNIDSILHLYKESYYNLPVPIKSFFGELYGNIPLNIRFGKDYNIQKSILEKFDNGTEQFKLDYMFNKTYETLHFAYEHIPYYKRIFDECDFKLSTFHDFNDLKKIPFLTKKIILENIDELYTNKFDKPVSITTGGSTWHPMKFYVPLKVSRAKEKAYLLNVFKKIGYSYRDRTLVFRDFTFSTPQKNIYWGYEKVENYLTISSEYIDAEYVGYMIDEIKKFNPRYIYSYPSTLQLFVKACQDIGIEKLDGFRGIALTSENVPTSYITLFQNFFDCDIVSQYGHSERVSVAWRINNNNYNFMNSYGLVQIDNQEIIGTSFDNLVMPFIRYKTKDLVSDITYFPQTEIVSSVGNIDGRIQEFLVTKKKNLLCATQLSFQKLSQQPSVTAMQLYQDKVGYLTILIQSKKRDSLLKENILKEAKNITDKFDYKVEFVDDMKRTIRGKWIYCIQKLDIEKYR